MSRWEGGAFPKRIGLPRIAAALGKPVEWFQEVTDSNLDDFKARLAALEKSQGETQSADAEKEHELLELFRNARPVLRESILKYAKGIALGNKDKDAGRRRRRS